MSSSTYGFTHNLHSVLECLDTLRQTINDFVLLVESLVHFSFQGLPQSHEFGHSLLLELLNILVLHLELLVAVVFELAQLQGLVSSFLVDLLV